MAVEVLPPVYITLACLHLQNLSTALVRILLHRTDLSSVIGHATVFYFKHVRNKGPQPYAKFVLF